MDYIQDAIILLVSVISSVFTSYHALRERILKVELRTGDMRERQNRLEELLDEREAKIEKKLEVITQLIYEINLKLERNNLK